MPSPTSVTLTPELKFHLSRYSVSKGISMAMYLRILVLKDATYPMTESELCDLARASRMLSDNNLSDVTQYIDMLYKTKSGTIPKRISRDVPKSVEPIPNPEEAIKETLAEARIEDIDIPAQIEPEPEPVQGPTPEPEEPITEPKPKRKRGIPNSSV